MSEYFLWCLLNVPASCVAVTVWYDFYVRLCVWTQALDWVFWCFRCTDIKVKAALTKTWKSHFIKNMGLLKSQLWYLICNLSGILILHSCWMTEVIHTLTVNHCIAQLNLSRTRSLAPDATSAAWVHTGDGVDLLSDSHLLLCSAHTEGGSCC